MAIDKNNNTPQSRNKEGAPSAATQQGDVPASVVRPQTIPKDEDYEKYDDDIWIAVPRTSVLLATAPSQTTATHRTRTNEAPVAGPSCVPPEAGHGHIQRIHHTTDTRQDGATSPPQRGQWFNAILQAAMPASAHIRLPEHANKAWLNTPPSTTAPHGPQFSATPIPGKRRYNKRKSPGHTSEEIEGPEPPAKRLHISEDAHSPTPPSVAPVPSVANPSIQLSVPPAPRGTKRRHDEKGSSAAEALPGKKAKADSKAMPSTKKGNGARRAKKGKGQSTHPAVPASVTPSVSSSIAPTPVDAAPSPAMAIARASDCPRPATVAAPTIDPIGVLPPPVIPGALALDEFLNPSFGASCGEPSPVSPALPAIAADFNAPIVALLSDPLDSSSFLAMCGENCGPELKTLPEVINPCGRATRIDSESAVGVAEGEGDREAEDDGPADDQFDGLFG